MPTCSGFLLAAVVAAASILAAVYWNFRRSRTLPTIRPPPAFHEAQLPNGLDRKLISAQVPLYSIGGFLSVTERSQIIALARPLLQPSATGLSDRRALQAGWRRSLVLCLAELTDHRLSLLPVDRCVPLVRRSFSHPTMSVLDASALLDAGRVDKDRDGFLSKPELTRALSEPEQALEAVARVFQERPNVRLRQSETAWLDAIPQATALRVALAQRLSLASGTNFTYWDTIEVVVFRTRRRV